MRLIIYFLGIILLVSCNTNSVNDTNAADERYSKFNGKWQLEYLVNEKIGTTQVYSSELPDIIMRIDGGVVYVETECLKTIDPGVFLFTDENGLSMNPVKLDGGGCSMEHATWLDLMNTVFEESYSYDLVAGKLTIISAGENLVFKKVINTLVQ